MSRKASHSERILNLLQASWPNWVPAPELAKISLQYSARIFSLRKHFEIANKVEIRNGTKCGFFRLGSPPVPRSDVIRATSQPTSNAHQFNRSVENPLFDLHREPD
ncbi:MAG: hypothetical protein ACRD20_13345 [Terriglobales bacterium]